MIKREKYIRKIESVLEIKKSVFLMGARQVGKTSLMKYMQKTEQNVAYMNFDEIATGGVQEFENLQEFLSYIQAYFGINIEEYDLLLFDEVVRIKNFHIILKALIDANKDIKYICSASGNYESVHTVLDGLAGRVVKIEVFPLDFYEYLIFQGKNISLENMTPKLYTLIESDLLEYLTFGNYPEVALEKNYEKKVLILKSIIDSVFEKDLRAYIPDNKMFELDIFISYLSKNIGSLLSYEGVSKELGIKLHDVKNFIQALEKSYLIFRLSPFFRDKNLEYSKRHKIYFHNFGIPHYFSGKLQKKKIIDGQDVEQTVYLHLKYNLQPQENLFFYQKVNGSKIDFILQKGGKIFPIEAKLTNRDTIPKIFLHFQEKYAHEVGGYIKTTKNTFSKRDIDSQTQIQFQPFYL